MKKLFLNYIVVTLLTFLVPFCALSQIDAIIGAGANNTNTANGSTTDAGPIYISGPASTFVYSKHHYVYTASELSLAGIPSGVLITKIAWNKGNTAGYSSSAAAIFDIYLKNSTATGVPPAPQSFANITSGATQVYASTSQTFPTSTGWVEFILPTPFLYTGSALEVTTNWDISAGGGTASGATGQFSWLMDPGTNILAYCNSTQSSDFTSLRTVRAQIKFTYMPATPCVAPPTPGLAEANKLNVCAYENFSLSLSGNSLGTGQTYQWQSSSTGAAPWTDIGSPSSSPALTINQATTTWYRCAVTCSGNTAYSTPIEITTPSLIGGTYTINDALPTGGGNFASFADAISYIGCGINAPVVFNVEPGSGPYLEQVVINPIGGASATNTVTFNGNGATIQYSSSNSAARAGIHLNGADHIIIDSLNIDGSAGTYAWGIVLTNRADSNIIRKCTINVGSNVTTSNYLGIIINGSATTTSTAGNNGNGNLIENNHIVGGYYGMFIYGGSTFPSDNNNNKIIGNTIEDYYYYAMYVYYQSSGLVISKNDISRPTRTTVTTTYGLYIGTGSVGALIEKNRIHNLFDGAPNSTSLTYCLYLLTDGTAANPTRVENNAIYSIGGNGSLYGLYNSGAAYMKAYHNTISLDNTAATAGATYGFYQVTSDNGIEFKNNIVNITRGGSGAKYCIYKSTAATPIASDNNVLYVNSAGSGAQNIGYQTTAQATLTDWQTATSQDGNSISVDPLFADPTMGDYTPTESQVDDMGAPLGVMTDILDSTRSAATPDPGAWELAPVAGIDIKPESLYSPTESAEGCYNTETLVVRVKNSGTQDINFATNNLTVTISVTGAATATYSATVTSGMLVSGATQDITMATPGATLDMSVVGQYSFEITTNLVGDINPANNTITQTREKIALSGGTAGASPDSYCAVGGTPTLSVTGAEGYSSVQWQSSTTSGSGFSDISGATTATYTLSTAISQTMYFRLKAVCGSNTEYSMEKEVVLNNPQLTSTTPGSRCGPGSVTLGATSNASTINWYENPTGGTPVGTGNSFTTPLILSTTTYYAAAGDGGNTQGIPGDGGWDHVTASGAFQTTTITSAYMILTVSQQLTLSSFDIYPSATIGTAFSIEARTGSASGPMYKSYTGTTTVTNSGTPTTAQTVPVNWDLAPGTYYIGFISNPNTWRSSATHTFPWTISGLVSLDYYLTPSYQYYFYNLQITTGCEGTRTPVVATINAATPVTASATLNTVCDGGTTTLNVTSSNAGYTYNWQPVNINGSSITVTPSVTTKYFAIATDNGTGCTAVDSVIVTVQPTIMDAEADPSTFCITGGISQLSLDPATGYASNSIQWQSSSDGSTYTDITGANAPTYTTPTINATTYYRALAKNSAGTVCSQGDVTVEYNNPQITGTTPGKSCGAGMVTLGATSNSSDINWYENPTGGTPVGTGNTFTTPYLSNTTTYYAAANNGGSLQFTGMTNALGTATSGAGLANFGIVFDAISEFELKSVVIYPIAASANTPGTVSISVVDANNIILHTETVNIIGNPVASAVGQRVYLNFNIQPGNNLKLYPSARGSGITGLLFEPSASAPNGNYGYPYVIPGVLSINTSTLTIAPTNTPRNDLYYYFYDWEVVTGCEGARVPVVATIDYDPGCVVPVTFTSFTGKKEGTVNILSWTTATEVNNVGYELQRSADGR
ncbi:MAG: hypothetical protein LC122_01395, partial [Chitinophagales bacterium]|nr:hypothetical protein [Chitinophagales bacterium]